MYSDDVAPEVVPVSADDAQAGKICDAPPSYEEVIGQFETSVKTDQSQALPALAYIDIMPRLLSEGDLSSGIPPTFQNFGDILTGANMWLAAHPGLMVWKCETVERKVDRTLSKTRVPVSVNLNSMLFQESVLVSNCFVIGLRMWLCRKFPGQTLVQQLDLINIVPSNIAEGLKKTVTDFNRRLKSRPIPGTILNVESTALKWSQEAASLSLERVATAGSWYAGRSKGLTRQAQILRVFFVLGPSTSEEIQMQEFLPEVTHIPQNSLDSPAFGHFEGIMSKARDWLCAQSGIRVVNIETREGSVKQDFNMVRIDTDRTDTTHCGEGDVLKARYLRLYYVADSKCPSMEQSYLCSKLFMPVCLGGKSHETMTQTMDRVEAWVKAVGLPIVSVETYCYQRRGSGRVDETRSDFIYRDISGEEWLITIRVYFASKFDEPHPSLLPPPPAKHKAKGSSSCSLL